ncbi:gamma-glutamyl-gamma-aminobutyrate hydrolase family protein [bacterium]|nr:gamma-glutamyl-gamma-aminobutyrate hydrolase family protein [bacterium]
MQIQPKFLPSGAAATPHPKPSFKPEDGLDTVIGQLQDQWQHRMQGQQRCTVGIFVEKGYKPAEAHDDVLDLADAVMDAGGMPRLLYQGQNGQSAEQQVSQVDAVLVPGGRDWDPAKYGEKLGPHMDPAEPDTAWDNFEIAGMRYAVGRDMPLFGQCRGEQGLNVALGGTLYQDLPSDRPGPVNHRPAHVHESFANRIDPAHGLEIKPDTRLYNLVGGQVEVNSIHHQAIKDVAPALEVIARAPDGLAEAVQVKDHPWQWAVQFHPESLRYSDGRFQTIYQQLVDDGERFRNHQPLK